MWGFRRLPVVAFLHSAAGLLLLLVIDGLEGGRIVRARAARSGAQARIESRPKVAPCGSVMIAKRPPGKSPGAIISRAPAPIAFW